jgi:hypothetical protein
MSRVPDYRYTSANFHGVLGEKRFDLPSLSTSHWQMVAPLNGLLSEIQFPFAHLSPQVPHFLRTGGGEGSKWAWVRIEICCMIKGNHMDDTIASTAWQDHPCRS